MKRQIYFFLILLMCIMYANCQNNDSLIIRENKSNSIAYKYPRYLSKEVLEAIHVDEEEPAELNKDGLRLYRQKKYEEAAEYFKQAIEKSVFTWGGQFSFYTPPAYNLACMLSILYGKNKYKDLEQIITYLGNALDADRKYVWRRKVDSDPDFNAIRHTQPFKQLLLRYDLRNAIMYLDYDYVQKNIGKITNIHEMDSFGNTLLFYAIKEKDFKSIDLLLKHKANINHCFAGSDNYQSLNSPLLYLYQVIYTGLKIDYYDLISFLIKRGADVNVTMKGEFEYKGFEEHYFLMKGIHIGVGETGYMDSGQTLLWFAMYLSEDRRYIDILFEHNIDLSFKTDRHSPFLQILKFPHDSRESIEWRNYVIGLLKKHKDKENANRHIKWILGGEV